MRTGNPYFCYFEFTGTKLLLIVRMEPMQGSTLEGRLDGGSNAVLLRLCGPRASITIMGEINSRGLASHICT